ncbi:VCBS repeat-containing protein [Rhodobacteraceae bacterium B1Z28]|uniref:VCBS repeat-containing protein n=1 Tax=Ruegeria haliotis TaxID=2747601 RepID=A0ABX2PL52_9RHOB|nr:VCBS repeat-containing protein [Ruegeria haliotis]NVO54840.1 VCBS repeat-containing protein [Ruegeria haliotis]
MHLKAPRLPDRLWQRRVRGALLGLCTWLAGSLSAAAADVIISARYTEPTTRYAHGVLGDAIEYGALEIRVEDTSPQHNTFATDLLYIPSIHTVTVRLPSDRVFEDLMPRLVEIDQSGMPKVLVVETQEDAGAQLAIYNALGHKIATTPHIGTRNRWLAPIGAADLDGDGNVEIAYIDRPHLAKTLRIWRFEDGSFNEIATLHGLTNHRIGEDFITGGIRDCGTSPELIVASADWQKIVSVRYDGEWKQTPLARFSHGAIKRALACSP